MPEPPKKQPSLPSDETLRALLSNQGKELELRASELALRQAELNHGAKWAEKSLEAQVEDRKDERIHEQSMAKYRYAAFGVAAVAVLAFAAFALYLNKDAIVLEALKLVGSAAIGFGGGYAYGRGKASQHSSDGDGDGEPKTP